MKFHQAKVPKVVMSCRHLGSSLASSASRKRCRRAASACSTLDTSVSKAVGCFMKQPSTEKSYEKMWKLNVVHLWTKIGPIVLQRPGLACGSSFGSADASSWWKECFDHRRHSAACAKLKTLVICPTKIKLDLPQEKNADLDMPMILKRQATHHHIWVLNKHQNMHRILFGKDHITKITPLVWPVFPESRLGISVGHSLPPVLELCLHLKAMEESWESSC